MSKKAFAYFRTSSQTNVGEDRDTLKRQRAAVEAYAAKQGIEIVGEEYDAAVSGADPLEAREGFVALLARIAGNGARTILVETANRFARDLIVQETGWKMLRDKGIELIAVDSPRAFLDDTPTAIFIRQVLGAAAQLDKAMTVAKLRGARERKRRATGKCEGRKSLAELRPDVVALARELRRWRPKPTLRAIATELAARGHLASSGKPFEASVVARMVRGDTQRALRAQGKALRPIAEARP
jgi:DNA invertase Pin-like site-specific DNA recombinase